MFLADNYRNKTLNGSGTGSSGVSSADAMSTSGSRDTTVNSTDTDQGPTAAHNSSLDNETRSDLHRLSEDMLESLLSHFQAVGDRTSPDGLKRMSSKQLQDYQDIVLFAQSCLGFAYRMHQRRAHDANYDATAVIPYLFKYDFYYPFRLLC